MKEYWKEVLIATLITIVGAVVTWILQLSEEDKSPTIVVQIPQSQKLIAANTSGELEIPKIYDMTYHDARKKLLDAGWIPDARHYMHGNDLYGNGKIFWDKGYTELNFCSGTGIAACQFEFVDPSGRKLAVITAGEEYEDGSSQAGVFKVKIMSAQQSDRN